MGVNWLDPFTYIAILLLILGGIFVLGLLGSLLQKLYYTEKDDEKARQQMGVRKRT